MKGSRLGLIRSTVPVLACRNSEKPGNSVMVVIVPPMLRTRHLLICQQHY